MTADFASHSRPGGKDTARGQIIAFIAELAAAGVRPTQHSRCAGSGRRASITVVGWSVGGCRGLWRGCGPGCELVVTTNANLVVMCDQPQRPRLFPTRPRYADLSTVQDLHRVLATGRSLLLPRPMAA